MPPTESNTIGYIPKEDIEKMPIGEVRAELKKRGIDTEHLRRSVLEKVEDAKQALQNESRAIAS